MSNYLAIATVTNALSQVVRKAVPENIGGPKLVVTQRPTVPTDGEPYIYLYLYQVSHNAALRNADLPTRTAQGDLVRRPQVALDLHYLLAFYGDEAKLLPQRMLGAVVRDFHARPVLLRNEISDASDNLMNALSPPDELRSNLEAAPEQIKLAPLPLTLDELSKLWQVFLQTPYALSVVYQASVVLIEAEESVTPAKPVLRRGRTDRGVETSIGPAPFLDGVHIIEAKYAPLRARLRSYPSAQLDDLGLQLTFSGGNLIGDKIEVRFHHPLLQEPITLLPERSTANEVMIDLAKLRAQDKERLVAGLYSVDVAVTKSVQDGEQTQAVRTTNALPLALAPRIRKIEPPNPVVRQPRNAAPDAPQDAMLTITCSPQIQPKQPALLLLAGREVQAAARVAPSDRLTFVIQNAPIVSDELVYLRVGGVTSMPFRYIDVDKDGKRIDPPQLAFDDAQRVTIA